MYDPVIWGPSFWRVFILAAERMPLGQIRRLAVLMGDLLPCVHCRASYAEYCKTLSPMTAIRDRETAILYMWTVKDLVNEKLGQGFLPKSKLNARTCALTQYASASDVMDVISLAALSMESAESRVQSYAEVVPLLCGLCALVDERPKISLPPFSMCAPADTWRHALACRNALNASRGLGSICEDEFIAQYEHARASEAPSAAAARQTSLRRSRAHTAGHAPRSRRDRR